LREEDTALNGSGALGRAFVRLLAVRTQNTASNLQHESEQASSLVGMASAARAASLFRALGEELRKIRQTAQAALQGWLRREKGPHSNLERLSKNRV